MVRYGIHNLVGEGLTVCSPSGEWLVDEVRTTGMVDLEHRGWPRMGWGFSGRLQERGVSLTTL